MLQLLKLIVSAIKRDPSTFYITTSLKTIDGEQSASAFTKLHLLHIKK